jgi:ComF family protein
MRFFDFLFPPRVDEALLRDVTTDEFLVLMAPRLVSQTRPDTVALLPFSHPTVRAAIHEAKYHGSEHAFKLLGATLAEYIRDMDEMSQNFLLVPVPLGARRSKERGFNQITEVATRTVKELKIPIDTTLLVRTRETVSQVSLPRHKREENMRGAFGATRPANLTCTYLLVDDVLTTGATLQAAIDALRDAGATHIIPLALAH